MVVINNNTDSLSIQRELISSTQNLNTSIKRLSSGLRVNSAADDAAGFVLAERFVGQSSSTQMAKMNAQIGINLLQVLDNAYAQIEQISQRIGDLALQLLNGTPLPQEQKLLVAYTLCKVVYIMLS